MKSRPRLAAPDLSPEFCTRRLKALADRTRWDVVARLLDGPLTVTELTDMLTLDQTLLSHHLKILRDEGFVEFTREGKKKRYRLARDVQLTRSGRGIDLGCCTLELKPPARRPRHT